MSKPTILIGLDRDGTLNYDSGFFGKDPNWKSQLKLLPGVIEGINLLTLNYFTPSVDIKLIIASNQAGVARGYFDIIRVEEVNSAINLLLVESGGRIDSWQYCPYVSLAYAKKHSIDSSSPWVKDTDLRKPGTGMLAKAAKELGFNLESFVTTYFVGDKADDVQTGLNLGGTGVFIDSGIKGELDKVKRLQDVHGSLVYICTSFGDFVSLIAAEVVMYPTSDTNVQEKIKLLRGLDFI